MNADICRYATAAAFVVTLQPGANRINEIGLAR